jgi:hypothetical protein
VSEIIVQRTGKYWLDDEGILHGVLTHPDFGLPDAMEMMVLHRQMAAGVPRCLLVDITAVKSLPREVRTYFSQPEHVEVHRAVAMVVGSLMSRATGNFFIGLNKPIMPTRLFNDEAGALAWLRTFLPAK